MINLNERTLHGKFYESNVEFLLVANGDRWNNIDSIDVGGCQSLIAVQYRIVAVDNGVFISSERFVMQKKGSHH